MKYILSYELAEGAGALGIDLGDLREFPLPLQGLRDAGQPFAVALCSPDTSTYQPHIAGEELVVWMEEGVHRLPVGLRPAHRRLDGRPHRLHVLLRHRLLLKPGGSDGFGLGPESAHRDRAG